MISKLINARLFLRTARIFFCILIGSKLMLCRSRNYSFLIDVASLLFRRYFACVWTVMCAANATICLLVATSSELTVRILKVVYCLVSRSEFGCCTVEFIMDSSELSALHRCQSLDFKFGVSHWKQYSDRSGTYRCSFSVSVSVDILSFSDSEESSLSLSVGDSDFICRSIRSGWLFSTSLAIRNRSATVRGQCDATMAVYLESKFFIIWNSSNFSDIGSDMASNIRRIWLTYVATVSCLRCLRRIASAYSSLSCVDVRKLSFSFRSKSFQVWILSRSNRNQSRALPNNKWIICEKSALCDSRAVLRNASIWPRKRWTLTSYLFIGGLSPLKHTFQWPMGIGFTLSINASLLSSSG